MSARSPPPARFPRTGNGEGDSHIEGDLAGTAVGGVRNFSMGGSRTRQRLLAHSDVDPLLHVRELCGLRVRRRTAPSEPSRRTSGRCASGAIVEGDRLLAEWPARYVCPERDDHYWSGWLGGVAPDMARLPARPSQREQRAVTRTAAASGRRLDDR
ncbi:MAG: hypothetical protein WKF83_16025 [Nocardioidaceae bacterium]